MAIREEIILETGRYKRQLKDIEKETDRTTKKQADDFEKSGNRITKGFKKIGAVAKVAIAAVAVSAFLALKKALGVAQDVEETASKFETVLGPSIDKANKFIEENARLMGLSNTQAKEMVATTAAIAQGMGFVGSDAANMSTEIVKLAGDLQSFNDVPIERTHNAITTALTGEREALKSLGIVVREAEVQERALVNTGKENAAALTQQEKATATLQIITEKAGVAVGDLERTQSSAANRSRQVQAELQNIWETLSSRLTPAMQSGLNVLSPLVDKLADWVEVAPSEEIIKERNELNNLVAGITSANTTQGRRNELITELQGKYPDFLGNLDAEKVTNEEIAGILKDVNKEYANRIAIAMEGEKVAEAQERVGKLRNKVLNEEMSIRENLNQVIREQGIEVDLTGKTELERINAVRSALRESADFGEGFSLANFSYGDANESARALHALAGEGLRLTRLNAQLVDAEKEAAQAEERRNEIIKSLTGSTNDAGDAQQDFNTETNESNQIAGRSVEIGSKYIEVVTGLATGTRDLGSAQGILKTELNAANDAATVYTNKLIQLENQHKTGAISQEEYEQAVESASEAYLKSITESYKRLKGQMTPEMQKFFNELIKLAKEGNKETDGFKTNLDDIADAVSGILNLADAFGDVSQEMQSVIRGSADILRNIQNIRDLKAAGNFSGLNAVLPVVGVAGGLASIISNILPSGSGGSSGPSMDEMRELYQSIQSNIRALERNTAAIKESSVIGSQMNSAQIAEIERIMGILTNFAGINSGAYGATQSRGLLTELQEQLSAAGVDIGVDLVEQFENYLEQGHTTGAALQMVLGLTKDLEVLGDGFAAFLQDLIANVGEYGDSIGAAIKQFRDAIRYGSKTTEEAFDDFVGNISDDLSFGLKRYLKRISNLDPSSEFDREWIQKYITSIYENRDSWMGDLTPDEYEEILEFLQNYLDGVATMEDAPDSISGGFTKNVAVSKAITEFSANEMIMIEEAQLMVQREMLADMKKLVANAIPTRYDPGLSSGITGNVSSVNSVNLGGISINGGMSDADIQHITSEITRELKKVQQGYG